MGKLLHEHLYQFLFQLTIQQNGVIQTLEPLICPHISKRKVHAGNSPSLRGKLDAMKGAQRSPPSQRVAEGILRLLIVDISSLLALQPPEVKKRLSQDRND